MPDSQNIISKYIYRNKDSNKWLEYERRKKDLQRKNLTPEEYEEAIKKIAKELGV
jgi:hypothetical protein